MKIHLALILISFFSLAGFGQAVREEKLENFMVTKIDSPASEQLSPDEKNEYLKILREIDKADAAFAKKNDAAKFYRDVSKAVSSFIGFAKESGGSETKTAFASLVADYMDTSFLIYMAGERRSHGGTLDLVEYQKANLEGIRLRYQSLLDKSAPSDPLDDANVAKIYSSAMAEKKAMREALNRK